MISASSTILPICIFDQKFNRKEICSDTLKIIKNDPFFLNSIITCDETWIFTYDPETKRQSMHWKTPTSPRIKKARMSKSKFKAMLIIFFDIKGIIFIEWVPSGQTVNQYYYKEVLIKLRERVRKKTTRSVEEWLGSSPRQCSSSQCIFNSTFFD